MVISTYPLKCEYKFIKTRYNVVISYYGFKKYSDLTFVIKYAFVSL